LKRCYRETVKGHTLFAGRGQNENTNEKEKLGYPGGMGYDIFTSNLRGSKEDRMKHVINNEDNTINWNFQVLGNGNLILSGNGKNAVLIDKEGRLTITQGGTDLGLIFRGQIDKDGAIVFKRF